MERGRNSGRVQNYQTANSDLNPCGYVVRVADFYEKLKSYLYQIQVEKSALVWEPLFKEMQLWAYNYLRLKNFSPGKQTFQLAKDCAATAGGLLVNAYFPYDTPFEAWACTIVQNQCKKMIARQMRAGHLPDHKVEALTDLPPHVAHTVDLGGSQLTEWRLTLVQLIEQLPPEEQETVFLYTFGGWTLQEVGQKLDISITTAHRRYFSAIDMLREQLTRQNQGDEANEY
jgi:RNA polymerase sigma factor (sigma-70 family)